MNRVALIALLVAPVVARAETIELEVEGREVVGPPNGYVAAGLITGEDEFAYQGVALEFGHRIGTTPLFARAMGQAGGTKRFDNPGHGTYVEGRIGGEARTCTQTGMLCGSVGIDVGIHRGRYDWVDTGGMSLTAKPTEPPPSMPSFIELDSMVIAPRVTVDGGGRVRVRLVLERPSHSIGGRERIDGFAGSLSLGIAF
jgi:hypothetical protein